MITFTREQIAEAFERLCCDRPHGCEGVLGVEGYCLLAPALDKLFASTEAPSDEAARERSEHSTAVTQLREDH